MIRAYKTRVSFASSSGKKRSMMTTHVMKTIDFAFIIPANYKLYFTNSAEKKLESINQFQRKLYIQKFT